MAVFNNALPVDYA